MTGGRGREWLVVGAAVALGCRVGLPLDVQTAEPGDVVITEVMINPAAVADHVGEWIEVHVPGDRDVDLDGMFMRTQGSGNGEIAGVEDFTAIVPAGGYAVIGRRDEINFASPELGPIAFWGQDPGFDDDDPVMVEIVGSKGTIDQTPEFEPLEDAEGVAWQLDPASLDTVQNDSPSAWCEAVTEMENEDLGTPGEINDPC